MDCMISDLKLGISKDRMGCHWNQWVSSCWRCFVAGILCLGSVVLLDDHEVPSSPRLRRDNFQLVWIASAWAKLMSGRERDYIFCCVPLTSELITCHGYFDRDSVIPVVHRFLNPLFFRTVSCWASVYPEAHTTPHVHMLVPFLLFLWQTGTWSPFGLAMLTAIETGDWGAPH